MSGTHHVGAPAEPEQATAAARPGAPTAPPAQTQAQTDETGAS